MSELLYQVAILDITEAYSFVLGWLRNENLKGLTGLRARAFFFDEDAHVMCWRTIGGYHSKYPALQELALRDITDDRYFLICYRILREEDTGYLFRFFPEFIRLCKKERNPFATFNNEFYDINKNSGPEFFKKFPEEIQPRLTEEEKKFFEDAITKVRYELKK